MRSKMTTGLLALFLGGLGTHKFYLGHGMQGALYLLFCWTFMPAAVAFIEGLIILWMSEETFQQRYGDSAVASDTPGP
jgi:TM2 domain-containing membrane protein YozV